jgi:hypothetical protein
MSELHTGFLKLPKSWVSRGLGFIDFGKPVMAPQE